MWAKLWKIPHLTTVKNPLEIRRSGFRRKWRPKFNGIFAVQRCKDASFHEDPLSSFMRSCQETDRQTPCKQVPPRRNLEVIVWLECYLRSAAVNMKNGILWASQTSVTWESPWPKCFQHSELVWGMGWRLFTICSKLPYVFYFFFRKSSYTRDSETLLWVRKTHPVVCEWQDYGSAYW